MKNRIKNILLFIVLLIGSFCQAQTGIGTTTPATKLHVKSNGATFRLEGTDNTYMEFYPQGSSTRYGLFGFQFAGSTDMNLMNQSSNGALILSTNNTERLRINSAGRVGIGTSFPATSLHIENSNVLGSGNPSSNNVPSLYIFNTNNTNSDANAIATIRTGGTNGGKPFLTWDVANIAGFSMGINNPTGQLVINNTWDFSVGTVANNMMIMNRTGQSRVIIPSSAGSYVTDWPSGWGGGLATFDFSCAGIYYNTLAARSDIRLKKDINPLSNDLRDKFMQLNPVTYHWKDTSKDPKLQYGLIAQETEKIFPEMVSTATDEMQTKSINYQDLHAISIKVIQEQQKQIELLLKNQKQMEKRIKILELKNKKK